MPQPTSAPDLAKEQALAAYRAMWQDMASAGRTADYRSPALAEHAAGQALTLLVRGLRDANRQGVVIKGEPTLSPKVTDLKPTESAPTAAEVADCLDSTRWLNYKRSGELQDDRPGGRRLVTATVGLLTGTWKVTRLQVQEVGSC